MIFAYYKKTYHRLLLEKLLRQHSHLIRGNILDIGSKNRRYDHLFSGQVTAVDAVPNKNYSVKFGDIEKGLALPDSSFDGLICFEVFEYLEHIPEALKEIYRLLRPGGQALISVPFLNHDHNDKHRLTKTYLAGYFPEQQKTAILTFGNGYTIIWDILRRKVSQINNRFGRRLLYLFLFPYLLIVKTLRIERLADDYYSGIFIVLRK